MKRRETLTLVKAATLSDILASVKAKALVAGPADTLAKVEAKK